MWAFGYRGNGLMSRPPKPDPGEEPVPGSEYSPALPWQEILLLIPGIVAKFGHLAGFTLNPKTGRVFSIIKGDEEHSRAVALALFRELVRGSMNFLADRNIYLIASTCHRGSGTDQDLKEGYEGIAKFSNQILIGYWVPERGGPYLDAVAPMQFISEESAITAGKAYGQEYILKITPDGDYRHIQVN